MAVDFSYLDTMVDGDDELRQTMLEMLLTEMPEEIAGMRSAYDDGDWDTLWKTSHKHKSTLAFVGHPEMIAAALKIETDAKAGRSPEALGTQLDTLETAQEEVLDAIRQALTN